MIMQLAALPEDADAEPQAADDVDEVFWAPVHGIKGMPGKRFT